MKLEKIIPSTKQEIFKRQGSFKETRWIVFKTIYMPLLINSYENWILIEQPKKRLEIADIKYFRRTLGI